MKPAAKIMQDKINKTNFKTPKYKIVNNVTANPETNPENIKKFISRTNIFYCKMERKYNLYVQ